MLVSDAIKALQALNPEENIALAFYTQQHSLSSPQKQTRRTRGILVIRVIRLFSHP